MTKALAKPIELPSADDIADARLPAVYESAKNSLAECSRIDECAKWANKAEALASYAKQSSDDALRKMADRIQARAIRRCGELLKEFDGRPENSRKQSAGAVTLVSRQEAARDAGLSKRQQTTAVRVANIPTEKFHAQVESDAPPTVTALAKQGTKPRPLIDLEGRDPKDFSKSTQAQGTLSDFAQFCRGADTRAIVRGAFPEELKAMKRNVEKVESWLKKLRKQLPR